MFETRRHASVSPLTPHRASSGARALPQGESGENGHGSGKRRHDGALIDCYNFFIFEVVKAHVAPRPKHPETLHYLGEGEFEVSGKIISRHRLFRPEGL